ncbi:glycine--tRNA ligase subunit beta [Hazenella sp. IB182357]|uniref:Glycine--tRNA ligase beta subunit n=1 Tax=Polycladospora coralii TaxID=2771432 RepID=A0A926RSG8_9BACL|nr:glycine--tRNA ligase subunit beta [Polycladospora coralii]MBD1371175.1 glycine--tRNA ligase subunit beta [Polycladospora coralii]
MQYHQLLLEIGCEEIPARFVDDAIQQLQEKLCAWLSEERISYGDVKVFSTPRRLAVLIERVAEKQNDLEEEIKGPPERIARTSEGEWSKAAEGFARKQGISTEQLTIKELKGEKYVYANVYHKGKPTSSLLLEGVPVVLSHLHFPKTMRWGDNPTRFIRPIRWMVCMLDEQIIPIRWAGVVAGNRSSGHRFLGGQVELKSAVEYEGCLASQFVIANSNQRRQIILNQIKKIEEDQGWVIPIDEDLLSEVVQLVEYPTALYGEFDDKYLGLPKPVLITTMREHQRYFPVEAQAGSLLPYFVTVRNGNEFSLEQVARGNEKVLRARLADAQFFYDEDLKLSIADALAKLDHMIFQEELGTVGDRVRRVYDLAVTYGKTYGLNEEAAVHLDRAAQICKFDLSTQMIGEFPELEGIMGADYAKHAGEAEAVIEAIHEHHLPRTAGGALPQSELGTILSLADKIEAVVASFSIGNQPTGSQDPYGLRRKTAAVIQLLLQPSYHHLSLRFMLSKAVDRFEVQSLLKVSRDELINDLNQFFALRLKVIFQENRIRYDVIDAVLEADMDRPAFMLEKAKLIMNQVDRETFKYEVDGFTRVSNLAQKADHLVLDPSRLKETAEKDLYQAWFKANEQFTLAEQAQNASQMYEALVTMVPAIHQFFDEVMVMVDDQATRQNRLSLLREIDLLTQRFMVFNQIVFA